MERKLLLMTLLLFLFICFAAGEVKNRGGNTTYSEVPVGVILDSDTLVGKMGRTSISMAIEDFYAFHDNYTTRLILHTRDSNNNVVQAASAAVDLLENVEVKAIIGPQKSVQASFLSNLANKSHVPLLSFSATSPSLTSDLTPYFVRTTLSDSSQVPAIASLIKTFGWREVVPVYEDTDFGRDIIPYFIDAFQEINTRIPYRSVLPLSATDVQITKELYKLMTMETRVFIVHMSDLMGSRLFAKAKQVGMMGKGYVWIMTDGLANVIDSLNSNAVINFMQGALGVKVHIPETKVGGDNFSYRWQKRYKQDHPNDPPIELSVYARRAYDTIWALALAAEQVSPRVNTSIMEPQASSNSTDLDRLGVSQDGERLLNAILDTRFMGVSGEFHIVNGQVEYSAFEIINVVGRRQREIGFWTQEHGISRKIEQATYSKTTIATDLNPVIWPGEATAVPKGWENPTSGKKLRIGVPVKNGFREFVNVVRDPITNEIMVTGYSIDVFEQVLQKLPYSLPHEYIPFEDAEGQSAGTYDDLIYQVYLQNYDAVVGDTTIRSNRSRYVDFTLPYTESGVAMIVPVHDKDNKNAWIFLKPLTQDLWLGSFAFFFFTGFVIWVIEHRINTDFRGSISQQLGTIFYFSFSTLFFAHRERVEHILSKFVVIIWIFVMLILTSSYTASLSSLLTVQQLQPTTTDIHELQKNGDYVGYLKGSFVEDLLKQLNFNESKMRGYENPEDYVQALNKGSQKGGVSAIIHQIPHIKLFLAKHCTGYTMVGPIYKTGGFGFVLPKGSPLVSDISRGILNVTDGDDIINIEKKWFGDQNACRNQDNTFTSRRLNFKSFWGLFLITGAASICSLLVFLVMFVYNNWHELRNTYPNKHILERLIGWLKYYNTRDLNFHTFRRDKSIPTNDSINIDIRNDKDIEASHSSDEVRHQVRIFDLSESDSFPREEEISFTEEASPNSETESTSSDVIV